MIETNTTKKDNGFFGGCLLIGQISIARYTPQVVCQIIWMLSYWVRVQETQKQKTNQKKKKSKEKKRRCVLTLTTVTKFA